MRAASAPVPRSFSRPNVKIGNVFNAGLKRSESTRCDSFRLAGGKYSRTFFSKSGRESRRSTLQGAAFVPTFLPFSFFFFFFSFLFEDECSLSWKSFSTLAWKSSRERMHMYVRVARQINAGCGNLVVQSCLSARPTRLSQTWEYLSSLKENTNVWLCVCASVRRQRLEG